MNTLFILRPISQEQELIDDDDNPGIECYHGTKMFVQTYYQSFLQIFEQASDEIQNMFAYKD